MSRMKKKKIKGLSICATVFHRFHHWRVSLRSCCVIFDAGVKEQVLIIATISFDVALEAIFIALSYLSLDAQVMLGKSEIFVFYHW